MRSPEPSSPVVEESVENLPSVSVVVEVPSVLNESPPSAQNPDLHTQNDGSNDSVEGDDIPVNGDDDEGEQSDSPVKSPEFSGFQCPHTEAEPATKPSPPREVSESTDAATGRQESGEDVPEKNEQSTGEWSIPPNTNTYGDEGPMLDSNDLQPLSSPRSLVSFNGLLDQTFEDTDIAISNTPPVEKKGGNGDDSPSHPSHDSYVPNPFYAIDKAHEERQQRESERADDSVNYGDDEDTINAEPSSFTGFSSSPTPRRSRRNKQTKKPAVVPQEASLISSVPESQWQDTRDKESTQPPASQTSEVVDLTQSSPASQSNSHSPEGNDENHDRSQQLPQGPGWVKKNLPKSQRRVQTLKEVSISPSTSVQGRGRRSPSRRKT